MRGHSFRGEKKQHGHNSQDKFDHDKGQKSAISGRRLRWRLSTGFFAFSPVFMCNLARRAPQNLEKVAKNPVEKIASNPVTSVAVMVLSALNKFIGPDSRRENPWERTLFPDPKKLMPFSVKTQGIPNINFFDHKLLVAPRAAFSRSQC